MNKKINEMAYPSLFNIEFFKSIGSFKKRIEYCERYLYRISSGSARIVYRIDDEKVLKLAKNNKGIAQNEEESFSYASTTGIGAQVFDFDSENYTWLEMELASKAKVSDFKRLLGYDFKFLCGFIDSVKNEYSRYSRNYFDDIYSDFKEKISEYELPNSEWWISLYNYMTNTGLESVGDLKRTSSWGIVKRNGQEELVLIDMGLNDDIAARLYESKKKIFITESQLKNIIYNDIKDYL